MENKFRIFFRKSTSGYQVLCDIEREPTFSWPYTGFLKDGREFTAEGALKYAEKYIEHRSKKEPDYKYVIDERGLKFARRNIMKLDPFEKLAVSMFIVGLAFFMGGIISYKLGNETSSIGIIFGILMMGVGIVSILDPPSFLNNWLAEIRWKRENGRPIFHWYPFKKKHRVSWQLGISLYNRKDLYGIFLNLGYSTLLFGVYRNTLTKGWLKFFAGIGCIILPFIAIPATSPQLCCLGFIPFMFGLYHFLSGIDLIKNKFDLFL
jgi:hypothetical protein